MTYAPSIPRPPQTSVNQKFRFADSASSRPLVWKPPVMIRRRHEFSLVSGGRTLCPSTSSGSSLILPHEGLKGGTMNERPEPAQCLDFSSTWCMESPEQVRCELEPAGATTEPSTHGDVQPSEPGDMGVIFPFLVFRRHSGSIFNQICLRKQHKELQKNQCSKPQ